MIARPTPLRRGPVTETTPGREREGREKGRVCLWLQFKEQNSPTFKELPLGAPAQPGQSWNLSPMEGKVGPYFSLYQSCLMPDTFVRVHLLIQCLVIGHILSSQSGRFAGCLNVTPFPFVFHSVTRRQSHPRIHLHVVRDGISATSQSSSCESALD